jgi:GDP-L-fucose synthase
MRLYVAGINGMVGSAISIMAKKRGFEVFGKSSTELDFTNRLEVFQELSSLRPSHLVIAAAKVGGIGANSTKPVEFLSVNLQIQTNLMDAAHAAGVERVLFLGSSCIYPKFAPQPIVESSLLTGELESSNAPYAIAKIAGLKLVEAYRNQFGHNWVAAMPTNLYGPRDNFNTDSAHVLPALIHKFHKAKISQAEEVEIWGDGTPFREFLYVEDMAEAALLLLEDFNEGTPINVGSGFEITISELALLVAEVVGFVGEINFDKSRPNGTPRKLLDSSRIFELGWKPSVVLESGIHLTYDWFLRSDWNKGL